MVPLLLKSGGTSSARRCNPDTAKPPKKNGCEKCFAAASSVKRNKSVAAPSAAMRGLEVVAQAQLVAGGVFARCHGVRQRGAQLAGGVVVVAHVGHGGVQLGAFGQFVAIAQGQAHRVALVALFVFVPRHGGPHFARADGRFHAHAVQIDALVVAAL